MAFEPLKGPSGPQFPFLQNEGGCTCQWFEKDEKDSVFKVSLSLGVHGASKELSIFFLRAE